MPADYGLVALPARAARVVPSGLNWTRLWFPTVPQVPVTDPGWWVVSPSGVTTTVPVRSWLIPRRVLLYPSCVPWFPVVTRLDRFTRSSYGVVTVPFTFLVTG